MFIHVSENLKKLSKFFPENLYVVGGYVRNRISGLYGGDVDICSSVNCDEVAKRLSGSEFDVKVKSLKFGSILISVDKETYEYTAFRKEVYPPDGSHCPNKVEFTKNLQDDFLRRDFTINAIYYNINKDECVDLCHGIVDLSDKILRAVGEANKIFESDGERILRLVRLKGELGFTIEKNTLAAAEKYACNVKDLQGNRKLLEMEKILYCDKRYNSKKSNLKKALNLLNFLKVWQYFDLPVKTIRYKKVYKAEDRVLGLLIDIVDNVQPECLEMFLDSFLKEQFGLSSSVSKKLFTYLAGYYDALKKLNNKEYFAKYFDYWQDIYPLLGYNSKHLQQKYDFFYKYIVEHEKK